MVDDGSMRKSKSDRIATFERNSNRLPLPSNLVKKASNSGLTGAEPANCWLMFLGPGRYRLVGVEAVSEILRQIEQIEAPAEALDDTGSEAQAAAPARIIPCTVSPPPPLWRLNFPEIAPLLVSDSERPSYVFVLVVAGFVELWFPDTLRRAVSVPISEILS
jgi:hypothetical protein